MADGLSVASGVVALVTFALQSSTVLYSTIRSFQSRDKNARALKDELHDLTVVLQSLLETISANPELDFVSLKLPLYRCGKTCTEYGELIAQCTKHYAGSRPSIRDWLSQQYLKGDICDFKEMLAGYKSTINIALANANLRLVTSMTPNAVEEYKDMIRDTTCDLQEQLERLDSKVQNLATAGTNGPTQDNPDWLAMLEEKESIQQGLKLCSQVSATVEELETTKEHPQFRQEPSAWKYIKNRVSATKGSIESLIADLQNHERRIQVRMDRMRSIVPSTDSDAANLAELQETKESIRQCIKVVTTADETLVTERRNVFEDVSLADTSYGITVSTVHELVVARRITLTGQARYVGGQLSDDGYQRTIDALGKLDLECLRSARESGQDTRTAGGEGNTGNNEAGEFQDRHGRGFKLSPSGTVAQPSEESYGESSTSSDTAFGGKDTPQTPSFGAL